jgi:hypothetical protein
LLEDNIENVKDSLLFEKDLSEPYDWMGLPILDKKIKKIAQNKYDRETYHIVNQKIDAMEPDQVKSYLKELLKDNMTVGLEILKNQ